MNKTVLILTGLIGLTASIFVGIGEHLLHGIVSVVDPERPYAFMIGLSQERITAGHFFAVLAAPFWLIGYWHVYKMLHREKSALLPALLCLIACYGFIMGTVWIGSRGMIASIVQLQAGLQGFNASPLVERYGTLMESLLTIIRATTLIFSAGFVFLVLRGTTYYPKWMALFNPFFLLMQVFLSFIAAPFIGHFLVPIAMNVAQGTFFAASTYCAAKADYP